MPTLLVTEGFRFFFFSNEGTELPHVHLEYGDGHAKFWLQAVELVEAHRMKPKELRRARLLVDKHQAVFLESWHEHFSP